MPEDIGSLIAEVIDNKEVIGKLFQQLQQFSLELSQSFEELMYLQDKALESLNWTNTYTQEVCRKLGENYSDTDALHDLREADIDFKNSMRARFRILEQKYSETAVSSLQTEFRSFLESVSRVKKHVDQRNKGIRAILLCPELGGKVSKLKRFVAHSEEILGLGSQSSEAVVAPHVNHEPSNPLTQSKKARLSLPPDRDSDFTPSSLFPHPRPYDIYSPITHSHTNNQHHSDEDTEEELEPTKHTSSSLASIGVQNHSNDVHKSAPTFTDRFKDNRAKLNDDIINDSDDDPEHISSQTHTHTNTHTNTHRPTSTGTDIDTYSVPHPRSSASKRKVSKPITSYPNSDTHTHDTHTHTHGRLSSRGESLLHILEHDDDETHQHIDLTS